MTIYRKTLSLLTPKEKRRGALVMVMVIVMAVFETAGVASVIPFLAVLGDPDMVHTNPVLAAVYDTFSFQSVDAFLFALGAAAFGLILFSAMFRIFTHYAMNRFIEMRRHSISKRLLETYLRQPYEFFLDRHSSDMSKSILSEVDQLVSKVFRPGLQMVAYSVVLLSIVMLLLVVDPLIALGVAGVVGGSYAAIFLVVRPVLSRLGLERRRANKERFEAAGEALGGIKDIKLLGRELAYLQRFHGPSVRQASTQASNQTISQVPKFLIEAIGFGGILVLALVLMATQGGATGGGLGQVLPMLGLYAFAGYRMLPAAQHIYAGMAKLRFGAAAVDGVCEDLHQREQLAEIHKRAPQALRLEKQITLAQISYTYPNAQKPALEEIHITVPVGSSLGIIGTTGSGKTTLVDLLLGLLRPSEGAIIVDGNAVTSANLRAWQQTLGYVPQEIFLTDTTVAENIALGLPRGKIDRQQVERCARMAQAHNFITSQLPQGYDTLVGERGVRLSGGQRQRIGIARALYHMPDVLVFDEATSALDTITEKAVMEAIESLSSHKTIILIAHRLSTVMNCDQVVLLEQGRLVDQGRYTDLVESRAGLTSQST
ncbi:MAG: ABC transporter ATP-binding protein [Gammaproteobacteria bacterium]|nr:ABC transporter ATP-binding protein [Gammaproteobacteria bacterium]